MKLRKVVISLSVGLFVLIMGLPALIFAWRAWENWSGDAAWKEYREAALRRGVKLDLADFNPPDVPEAENFAAIPLFQEAFERAADGQSAKEAFAMPSEFKDAIAKREKVLTLTEWRDLFLKVGLLDQASDDPVRDVKRALEHHEPALAQLRAASDRPHTRFPNDWTQWPETPNPQFAILQETTYFLGLRMRVNLAAGDGAAAYADWQLSRRLARTLEREPTLISGLVRNALRDLPIASVKEGLEAHQWKEAELRSLAADLDAIRARTVDDYLFAIESERAASNTLYEKVLDRSESSRVAAAIFPSFNQRMFPSGWVRRSQVRVNELCDLLPTRIDRKTGRVADSSLSEEIERERDQASYLQRYRCLLAHIAMPIFASAEDAFLRSQVYVDQGRVGCALELHRMAHGSFPAALGELVPALLPAVPIDPWDGQPLRYERTETGYRLWAIGKDRKDDGGEPPASKAARKRDELWQIPHPPRH